MDEIMERRGFVKLLAGGGLAGTALLSACLAEASLDGTLSPRTVEALLAFTDQTPDEEEMEELTSSIESHLENIRKVRAWSVPQAVEPSLKFRAGFASAVPPTGSG